MRSEREFFASVLRAKQSSEYRSNRMQRGNEQRPVGDGWGQWAGQAEEICLECMHAASKIYHMSGSKNSAGSGGGGGKGGARGKIGKTNKKAVSRSAKVRLGHA